MPVGGVDENTDVPTDLDSPVERLIKVSPSPINKINVRRDGS